MDSWVVPVAVAAIGAVATIAAAYIGYVKDRNNARSRILQDLEIAEKLPAESAARRTLEAYVEKRARLMPLEKAYGLLAIGAVTETLVLISGVTVGVVGEAYGIPAWRTLGVYVIVGVFLLFQRMHYRSLRREAEDEFLAKQDDSPKL
ncbi:hypothetical protein ACM0AU_05020 [Mycobacteroides abscessus subsp. abscessus]|uniref:hypothetical protein n=1 Tax=Mycobacteroides abscessus TaxID=36809 RepID=UPI0039EF3653